MQYDTLWPNICSKFEALKWARYYCIMRATDLAFYSLFFHLCPHGPSNLWPRTFAHALSSEKNALYLQASVLLSSSATQVLCSSLQLEAFLSHSIKPQVSPLSSAKSPFLLNLICSSPNMCYHLAGYVFLFLLWSSLPTKWRRKWQLTPLFLPGEYHGQRSLAGHSPWGQKESQTQLSD